MERRYLAYLNDNFIIDQFETDMIDEQVQEVDELLRRNGFLTEEQEIAVTIEILDDPV